MPEKSGVLIKFTMLTQHARDSHSHYLALELVTSASMVYTKFIYPALTSHWALESYNFLPNIYPHFRDLATSKSKYIQNWALGFFSIPLFLSSLCDRDTSLWKSSYFSVFISLFSGTLGFWWHSNLFSSNSLCIFPFMHQECPLPRAPMTRSLTLFESVPKYHFLLKNISMS